MAVVVTPESELGKELAKWEQHRTSYVGPDQQPGNPYQYRPYPKMLYKAQKTAQGKVLCLPPMPNVNAFTSQAEYLRAMAEAEALQQACVRVVESDTQERLAKGQGWSASPEEALAQFEQEEQALGNAAAEAAFAAQRMPEKARREFEAASKVGLEHLPDVTPAVQKQLKHDPMRG